MNIELDNISDFEEDLLKEIISISLAKVGDSFAVLTRQLVIIHVPQVDVISEHDLDHLLPRNAIEDTVVESDIKGELTAKDFLIIKPREASVLSGICLGDERDHGGNYNAMRKSLLMETNNILVGALVTQFANILGVNIQGLPPVIVPYRMRRTFKDLLHNLIQYKPYVLTVKAEFLSIEATIELPMIIVFDIDSIKKIVGIVRKKTRENNRWLSQLHLRKKSGVPG